MFDVEIKMNSVKTELTKSHTHTKRQGTERYFYLFNSNQSCENFESD